MPDAAALGDALRASEALAAGITFRAPDVLREVASDIAAVDEGRRDEVHDFVADVLDARKHELVPPPTLLSLARITSRWVVTLNYDLLLEEAARLQGIKYESYTWRTLHQVDHVVEDHPLRILHLHGSIAERGSLVLDSQSYNRLTRDAAARDGFAALLSTHRACFLGCALDEAVLQNWLMSLWYGQGNPRHVAVQDETAWKATTQGRGAWSSGSTGVHLEHFARNDFGVLDEFCEALVNGGLLPATAPQPTLELQTVENSSAVPASLEPQRLDVVVADLGSDWTRRALDKLGDDHPEELRELHAYLQTDGRNTAGLIDVPPSWLETGSAALWAAAARLAEQQGDWTRASRAWEAAAAQSADTNVECLVSASLAAGLGGDAPRAEELRGRATKADPLHSRLLLLDVDDLQSLDQQVDVLGRLAEDPNPDVRAIAAAHLAMAHLQRNELPQAQQLITESRALRPEMLQPRIAQAYLDFAHARARFLGGRRLDTQGLGDALDECLDIRDDLTRMRRWRESAELLVLSVDIKTLLGDIAGAEKLALGADIEELTSDTSRLALAEAAARGQSFAAASALLADVADDRATIIRAVASFETGTDADKASALEVLESIALGGGEAAVRAAGARIAKAHAYPSAGWNDDVAAVFESAAEDADIRPLKALWLFQSGDAEGADAFIKPHLGEIWAAELALHFIRQTTTKDRGEVFVSGGDGAKLVEAAMRLLALGPDHLTRLECARALGSARRSAEARGAAMVVLDDNTATASERADAFQTLVSLARLVDEDFQQALTWMENWAEEFPADERPTWGRIDLLTRLARFDAALRVLRGSGVVAGTPMQAEIAARALRFSRDADDALRELAKLREQLGTPNDFVERVIAALSLLRNPGNELLEDVAGIRRTAKVESLGGEFMSLEQVAEYGRLRAATLESALRAVSRGDAPVAVIARVAGFDIATAWRGLTVRPAGWGSIVFEERELANATTANGQGAVIDPTALSTIAASPDLQAQVQEFLGELRVAQASIDDISAGYVSFVDAAGSPNETELAGHAEALDGSQQDPSPSQLVDFVRSLRVEPHPTDAVDNPSLASLLATDNATAVRSHAGTYAVAERTGLAVYSDDRVVRAEAWQHGLPAFGTSAIIAALQARPDASAADAHRYRDELRRRGYSGIATDDEELSLLVTTSDGPPPPAFARILIDDAPWRADYFDQTARTCRVLAHAFRERQPHFLAWVEAVLDSMYEGVPLVEPEGGQPIRPAARHRQHRTAVMVTALASGMPHEADHRAFVGALRSALSTSGASDPLVDASRWLADGVIGHSPRRLPELYALIFAYLDGGELVRAVLGSGISLLRLNHSRAITGAARKDESPSRSSKPHKARKRSSRRRKRH